MSAFDSSGLASAGWRGGARRGFAASSRSLSSRLLQRRILVALGDGLAGATACLTVELLRHADFGSRSISLFLGPMYFGAAWIAVFLLIDGYAAQVPANRLRSVVAAVKATPYVGVLGLSVFFIKPYQLTRPIVVLSVLLGFLFVVAARLLLARVMLREALAVRVVVIGHENLAQELASAIGGAGFECRVVSWVPTLSGTVPRQTTALLEELSDVLSRQRVDDVVAARSDLKLMPELVEACTSRGIRIVSVGSLVERFQARLLVSDIDSEWLLQLPEDDLWDRPYLLLRRLADIAISAIVGLVLFPFLLLIAFLIKLDSPGPALLRQRRVGQHGREFDMLKLRSMTTDAEVGGVRWAQRRDPRITRLGRVLRAIHLDEAPQVINILRGEMSLIGPRPERPEFVALLEETVPHFRSRLVVKPGLTGWAQVNAGYAASIPEVTHKLEYDLYYVKNRSLRLDLQIMLMTAFTALGLRGN